MEQQPQKKPASFWWLVIINYLSSIIGAGVLLWLINWLVLLAVGITSDSTISAFFLSLINSYWDTALYLLLVALSTWHTAKYLKRTYVIPDPKKVVLWSAGLFVLVAVLWCGWDFFSVGVTPSLVSLGASFLSLVIFFLVSNKFLPE